MLSGLQKIKPIGLIALGLLVVLYSAALFASFLAPYSPEAQDLTRTYHPPTSLFFKNGALHVRRYARVDPTVPQYQPIPEASARVDWFVKGRPYKLLGIISTARHLFQVKDPDTLLYLLGSDAMGRDIFSRLLYGARLSLSIGLVGIAITLIMGFLIGGLAGYYGGAVDFAAMRVVEFLMAIPGLYLLLSLRAALADYFGNAYQYFMLVVILAFIGWASTARIIRGMTLSLRNRAFVRAAEAMGQSSLNILFKHILPNLSGYLLVAATLSIPGYILGEAALSFLGLGIQEPAASWGLMLAQAQNLKVFMLNFWWFFSPGVAIFITVVAFNILGDTLRDSIDPKLGFTQRMYRSRWQRSKV